MSLYISKHPLVGVILRQVNRPWDRFKVVSVESGFNESISWVSPGQSAYSQNRTITTDWHLFEVDPDQTDEPLNRVMRNGRLSTT